MKTKGAWIPHQKTKGWHLWVPKHINTSQCSSNWHFMFWKVLSPGKHPCLLPPISAFLLHQGSSTHQPWQQNYAILSGTLIKSHIKPIDILLPPGVCSPPLSSGILPMQVPASILLSPEEAAPSHSPGGHGAEPHTWKHSITLDLPDDVIARETEGPGCFHYLQLENPIEEPLIQPNPLQTSFTLLLTLSQSRKTGLSPSSICISESTDHFQGPSNSRSLFKGIATKVSYMMKAVAWPHQDPHPSWCNYFFVSSPIVLMGLKSFVWSFIGKKWMMTCFAFHTAWLAIPGPSMF